MYEDWNTESQLSEYHHQLSRESTRCVIPCELGKGAGESAGGNRERNMGEVAELFRDTLHLQNCTCAFPGGSLEMLRGRDGCRKRHVRTMQMKENFE